MTNKSFFERNMSFRNWKVIGRSLVSWSIIFWLFSSFLYLVSYGMNNIWHVPIVTSWSIVCFCCWYSHINWALAIPRNLLGILLVFSQVAISIDGIKESGLSSPTVICVITSFLMGLRLMACTAIISGENKNKLKDNKQYNKNK